MRTTILLLLIVFGIIYTVIDVSVTGDDYRLRLVEESFNEVLEGRPEPSALGVFVGRDTMYACSVVTRYFKKYPENQSVLLSKSLTTRICVK